MKTGRSGPKPLPTLTQVVIPAQPVQDYNTSPSIDSVLQRIMPIVEARMRLLLEQVLLEQKTALTSSLRSEIEAILGEIRATQGAPSGTNSVAVSVTKQLFDPG